jgi:hypothetical protein
VRSASNDSTNAHTANSTLTVSAHQYVVPTVRVRASSATPCVEPSGTAGRGTFDAADAEQRRLIREGFECGIPGEQLAEAAGLSVVVVVHVGDQHRGDLYDDYPPGGAVGRAHRWAGAQPITPALPCP